MSRLWAERRRLRGRLPALPVYTETLQTLDKNLLLAVRRGSEKLILRRTASGVDEDVRMFDLGADPGERDPASAESEAARSLLRLAHAYLDRASADAPQPTFLKLEPEALERLRALGYVQ